MAGSVGALLGGLFGAILITFILTRSVNYVAQKKTNPKNSALIAFFVAAGSILLMTSLTTGIGKGIIIYIPCLIFWLIIDLRRARNNLSTDLGANGKDRNAEESKTFKCTNCGRGYSPKDYRDDVPEWICAQCLKPLPKEQAIMKV